MEQRDLPRLWEQPDSFLNQEEIERERDYQRGGDEKNEEQLQAPPFRIESPRVVKVSPSIVRLSLSPGLMHSDWPPVAARRGVLDMKRATREKASRFLTGEMGRVHDTRGRCTTETATCSVTVEDSIFSI